MRDLSFVDLRPRYFKFPAHCRCDCLSDCLVHIFCCHPHTHLLLYCSSVLVIFTFVGMPSSLADHTRANYSQNFSPQLRPTYISPKGLEFDHQRKPDKILGLTLFSWMDGSTAVAKTEITRTALTSQGMGCVGCCQVETIYSWILREVDTPPPLSRVPANGALFGCQLRCPYVSSGWLYILGLVLAAAFDIGRLLSTPPNQGTISGLQ